MEFVYFIQLSNHMWDDGNGPQRYWYIDGGYKPTNDIDFAVWDKLVEQMAETKITMALIDVGDGVQYESHPEISAPDAVSKEFLKKKLDEMRARGITPIPKLNFSTEHHCWLKDYRHMVSSQIYRKVCVDLIDEVCELFDHPKLFHLGMDEESSYDSEQWREIVVMRGEKLFWSDFNLFFEACRKNGARPWVWGDYYWIHPDYFVRNMSKDVLISNWFYGHFATYTNWYGQALAGYENFEKMGFDQIPTCSTISNSTNPYETMIHCPKVIAPERLKGYCLAPWYNVTYENRLLLEDGLERFAAARKKVHLF